MPRTTRIRSEPSDAPHNARPVHRGSTVRTASAPRVMATLRSTAISLIRLTGTNDIAKTTRHHARDPARPVKLLLTC